MNFSTILTSNKFYKFYVPQDVDHVIFGIKDIFFASTQEVINIKVQANRIPTLQENLNNVYLNSENATDVYYITVWTKEEAWHYVQFESAYGSNSSLLFNLQMFSSLLKSIPFAQSSLSNNVTNQTSFYNGAVDRVFQTGRLVDTVPYKQYNLLKDMDKESFMFTYDLEITLQEPISVPINVTTDVFSTLRFSLNDVTDIGGE